MKYKRNNKMLTVFMAHMCGFAGMMLILLYLANQNLIIFFIGFVMIFANRWIVLHRYLKDKEG